MDGARGAIFEAGIGRLEVGRPLDVVPVVGIDLHVIGYCDSCSQLLPDGARFCPACGAGVLEEEGVAGLPESMGVALGTELRPITVVFCDLVGSTELSATTDPEEYSDLIQAYQHQAVTVARSYGGDVEGYSGDGILFRFGWPEAHDDDARQAVAAALDILSAVAALEGCRKLAVRVGIHSGPAVVGRMGGADRKSTMAIGETLNVAARLQGQAEPGTVVASSATVFMVEGLFEVEPLGALKLRGVPLPMEAFRVLRGTSIQGRIQAASRLSPFVGRVHELDLLADCWRRARSGHGTAVQIIGEQGVGKSRLALHARNLAGDDCLWLESSCSPYTQMSVLRPLVALVESALSLTNEPTPQAKVARIGMELEYAEVDLRDGAEFVAALLGIPGASLPPISGELRLERTIEVLVAWISAMSRRQPLVMLIEDLHWCDPTTIDTIQRLLSQIGGSSILLLLSARPEFEATWTGPDLMTLGLEPLGESDVRELVQVLAGGRSLPEPVVDRIVTSAAGIPLFVEEVERSVLESGLLVGAEGAWVLASPLVDLEIPTTLHGSLLARLDALGPAKFVAQLASVIGRTFSLDLLVRVSGMDPAVLAGFVDRVVASGLVRHESDETEGGLIFKHVLVQEVAYESLLRRNRRTIHERVARELSARIAAGSSVPVEEVARHYEAAGLLKESIEQFQVAAAMATERSGHREAIAFLQRGIALARRLPEVIEGRELEVEMQLALGSAIATRSYSDPELEAAYDRARQLCELLGSDLRVAHSLGGLSVFYINRGEVVLGAELAERVLSVAEVHHDDVLEVLGAVQLSLTRCYQGRPEESLALAERAIASYHPKRHQALGLRVGTDQGVAAHVFAGWSHLILGHLDRGLAQLIRAVDLAEDIGQPFNIAYALAFRATGHWERGEAADTLRFAEQAHSLAQEQGFDLWAGISGVWAAAEQVISQGDHAAVSSVLEAGLVAGETGNRGGSSAILARAAEATRAAGDLDTTWAILEMARSVSEDTGQPWWDSALYRMRAELKFDEADSNHDGELGDPEHPWIEAAQNWERSLELAKRFEYPVHGARAAAGYARLLERTGRVGEGRRLLESWLRRCTEGHGTPVLAGIRSELQRLSS
jgi:class 3 adenylate cyclase/tetratricopeptide (TPR) repeat protein